MNVLVLALAALSLQTSSSTQAPRQITVRSGDTILVGAGTNGRVVSTRKAQLRFTLAPDRRELVVLIDEEKGNAPPDGLVDRAYRYTLSEDFPEQYVFRGEGAVEDVLEIKDGDLRRPPIMTFVTAVARIRLGQPYADDDPNTVVIRVSESTGRMLGPYPSQASRTFDDVEYVWLNHQEDAQPNAPRASLSLRAQPAAAPPQVETGTSTRAAPTIAGDPDLEAKSIATPPRLLVEVKPNYAADAMRRGVRGAVGLKITVGTDGTVADVVVTRSLDPDLDAEAVKTVKEWRFSPAMRDGRPVPAIQTVEMTFTMRK